MHSQLSLIHLQIVKWFEKTTKEINEQLIPKLQTVDGVQNAQLNGQTTRQVTIKFKQDKLDEAGLTADDVENYIKTATRETPLGLFNLVIMKNH